MHGLPLFDIVEAARRRDVGMTLSAQAREILLTQARLLAHEHAARHGTVTADDVAALMAAAGLNYADLGNAAGSVFREGFVWTGDVRQSARVSTHRRLVRVWRIA
jgi:hypothetical protein